MKMMTMCACVSRGGQFCKLSDENGRKGSNSKMNKRREVRKLSMELGLVLMCLLVPLLPLSSSQA